MNANILEGILREYDLKNHEMCYAKVINDYGIDTSLEQLGFYMPELSNEDFTVIAFVKRKRTRTAPDPDRYRGYVGERICNAKSNADLRGISKDLRSLGKNLNEPEGLKPLPKEIRKEREQAITKLDSSKFKPCGTPKPLLDALEITDDMSDTEVHEHVRQVLSGEKGLRSMKQSEEVSDTEIDKWTEEVATVTASNTTVSDIEVKDVKPEEIPNLSESIIEYVKNECDDDYWLDDSDIDGQENFVEIQNKTELPLEKEDVSDAGIEPDPMVKLLDDLKKQNNQKGKLAYE